MRARFYRGWGVCVGAICRAAALLALARLGGGEVRADVQSFDFGTRSLTHLPADNALTFTPSIQGTVRGIYVTGTWTHVAGVNDASQFNYSVDGPGGADLAARGQGGSAATPFTFGHVPNWWSNGLADRIFHRYRGEFIATTAQANAGPWTVSLRNQANLTQSTFTSTRVHVLTDAAAPWSGSITTTTPTARLPFQLDVNTGAGITDNGQRRYVTTTYTAQATGLHLFTSLFTNGLQGRLFVYDREINPASTAGVIGVDRDATAPSGLADFDSAAIWIGLTAGRTYTIAVSAANPEETQGAGRTGDFVTYIAGPVPAPSTSATLLATGAWSMRRRRFIR